MFLPLWILFLWIYWLFHVSSLVVPWTLWGKYHLHTRSLFWVLCVGAIVSRQCITVSVMNLENEDPMDVPLMCWYICPANWKQVPMQILTRSTILGISFLVYLVRASVLWSTAIMDYFYGFLSLWIKGCCNIKWNHSLIFSYYVFDFSDGTVLIEYLLLSQMPKLFVSSLAMLYIGIPDNEIVGWRTMSCLCILGHP